MARFRCPSTSCEDVTKTKSKATRQDLGQRLSRLTVGVSGESSGSSSSSRKTPVKDDGAKRKRSGTHREKKRRIEVAAKQVHKWKVTKHHHSSFVFVGNVDPSVDESTLYRTFKHCGNITRIQIRCSRGNAVTIGRPHTPDHNERNRQYATVEFDSHSAVRRALLKNGLPVHGIPVVVCLSAAELPEVQEFVNKRLNRLRERKGIPSAKPDPRALRPQRTEDVEMAPPEPSNPPPPPRKSQKSTRLGAIQLARNVFMGVSFPKTVM